MGTFFSFSFKSILQSALHSSIAEGSSIDPPTADGPSHDVTNDVLEQTYICTIAEKLTDAVWFSKILKRHSP